MTISPTQKADWLFTPSGDLFQCVKCQKTFPDSDVVTLFYSEYPGGRRWPNEVSPCCHAGFVDVDQDVQL